MRVELKFILAAHLALFAYLFYLTFDLITLLNDDSAQDAISPSELVLPGPAQIPKIIHQTYKTSAIPEVWKEGQQACVDLHPDYQYILWTDKSSREFIAEHFSWFLETWDKYPYPIERADAIRYFVLSHYGGIYIDLDDGCHRKLDPLLSHRAFLRKTNPTGISNDVMGLVPQHPFFLRTIQKLKSYQRNWLVPYITIMISTGPLFLSVMWRQYKRWGLPDGDRIKILMPENYKGFSDSFFKIAQGSSWHQEDAHFIKGMGRHLVWAVIGGFAVAFLIFGIEYLIYLWVCLASFKNGLRCIGTAAWAIVAPIFGAFGYKPLRDSENPAASSIRISDPYGEEHASVFGRIRQIISKKQTRRSRKDSNAVWNDPLLNVSDTSLDEDLEKGVRSYKLTAIKVDADDSDSGSEHSASNSDWAGRA